MKVKVVTYKPSGKYYTEAVEDIPVRFFHEMVEYMREEIVERRIPGLEPGGDQNYHVLVIVLVAEDSNIVEGLTQFFPIGMKSTHVTRTET